MDMKRVLSSNTVKRKIFFVKFMYIVEVMIVQQFWVLNFLYSVCMYKLLEDSKVDLIVLNMFEAINLEHEDFDMRISSNV